MRYDAFSVSPSATACLFSHENYDEAESPYSDEDEPYGLHCRTRVETQDDSDESNYCY